MDFSSETLAGKHALICGGSKGIGRACAEAFAKTGARLTLLARPSAELQETCAGLPGSKGKHRAIACDFSKLDEVKHVIADIGGDVDILLCNGGGPPPGPLLDAGVEELETAFHQHLLTPTLLVQALAPGMKERRFGRIINIISTSVKVPIPGLGVSNTVRGAVANWAKTLAYELGPYGITVNNVLPGFTVTDRLEQIIGRQMSRTQKTREELETLMKAEIPARRFAEVRELAYACTFLSSDMAAYINGINLPIDGGRTGSL